MWVDTGRAPAAASREPSSALFLDLSGFDDSKARYRVQRQRQARERRAAKLEELRQAARREAFARRRLVAAGLAEPMTKAERRKIQLARRRLRWKIDPQLRARHLQLKREDAIRRGRRRGTAPMGSDDERRHRREGQRRRRQAERERDGRSLTGAQFRELRLRLGLSIQQIAARHGASYSAAKQWQRGHGPPGHVVAWLLALPCEREEVPVGAREFPSRSPPAASGYLEAQPL